MGFTGNDTVSKLSRYYEACKSCQHRYVTPDDFTSGESNSCTAEDKILLQAIHDSFTHKSQQCALLLCANWIPVVAPLIKKYLKLYIRTYGDHQLIQQLDNKTL